MRKGRIVFALLVILGMPAALRAQSVSQAAPNLRDRLMPANAALVSTTPIAINAHEKVNQPALATSRGTGMGLMIAGGALFVAGLLVEGDAGTVLVLTGAGIGAYGLYLHFR